MAVNGRPVQKRTAFLGWWSIYWFQNLIARSSIPVFPTYLRVAFTVSLASPEAFAASQSWIEDQTIFQTTNFHIWKKSPILISLANLNLINLTGLQLSFRNYLCLIKSKIKKDFQSWTVGGVLVYYVSSLLICYLLVPNFWSLMLSQVFSVWVYFLLYLGF